MMPSAKKQRAVSAEEPTESEAFNLVFLIATALDNKSYWENVGIADTDPKNPSFITKMRKALIGPPAFDQQLLALQAIASNELSCMKAKVPPTQDFFSFFQESPSRLEKVTIVFCNLVERGRTKELVPFIEMQCSAFPPQRIEAPSLPESSAGYGP
jgi:hypothetical protein